MTRLQRLRAIATHLIFWGWNIAFLLVVFAGILPFVGVPLIQGLVAGAVPLSIGSTLFGLMLVPLVCTLVGLIKFRTNSQQLGRLFYGVEAPLFFLCIVRLFLLRELPSGATFVVATVLAAIVVYFLELWQEADDSKIDPTRAWFTLGGQTAVFWVGAYSSLVLAFYVVPTALWLVLGLVSLEWVGGLWDALRYGGAWAFLSFILFGVSATLFLGMPFAMCWLYVRSGVGYFRRFAQRFGGVNAIGGFTAATVAGTIACLLMQQQPAAKALALFETQPQTDAQRVELLAQSDSIRDGLRHAYLSSYRYLSTTAENNHIYAIYNNYLQLPEGVSYNLQLAYNRLMAPFLYNGSRSDSDRAEEIYAEFFDTPIQKGERQAIRRALQSTFNQEEAQAGLINIDSKLVLLKQQDIAVEEHGDWAEVELHEQYQNQTFLDEEIFYSFALPESAVLTGVWLGNSDRLDERFDYRVSPRGAAQQVYQQEVRRFVDPALLEQVGPRQYRLRAFPIPAKQVDEDVQPELHLWMTYRVLQQERGWQLPTLLEHRNVFWSNNTVRTRQGQVGPDVDGWVEEFVPATEYFEPKPHEVTLLDRYKLIATPQLISNFDGADQVLSNLRLAVLLDRSYSMEEHKAEEVQLFNWLAGVFGPSNETNNDVDLYLFDRDDAGMVDDVTDFNARNVVNYGTTQLQDMLSNFQQMSAGQEYDAVLVVTDTGSYELASDLPPSEGFSAPLCIWHLGGKLPAAYDDTTLDMILNSGGGIATDLIDVVSFLEFHADAYDPEDAVRVLPRVDNYSWLLTQADSDGTDAEATTANTQEESAVEAVAEDESEADRGFEAIAARQLILGLGRAEGTTELAQLDRLHDIAKTYEVVSPYSSMIVLVNEQQEQDLDDAEAASDRFDREVESGAEDLTRPNDMLAVSGVPEPEEWMLIGLMAIALGGLGWWRWQQEASI